MATDNNYENDIRNNQAEAKDSLRMIKNILVDVPVETGKVILRNAFRRFNLLPKAGNVIDKLFDDINLLDVVDPVVDLGKQYFKNQKALIADIRKGIKNIERKGKTTMRKNNKKTNVTERNTTSAKTYHRSGANSTATGNGKNHPEWYLKDKTMVSQLVGINVANRQDVPLPYMQRGFVGSMESPGDELSNVQTLAIPAVAGLVMELVIPQSLTNDWAQGINMLYKNIRAANAGAINYSPKQLGNYVFTVRSIDAVLSTLGRAVKALNSGTFYDALSPQSYFTAMGLDYDTFAANAANARELYSRLSAIRYRLMPLNITLLDRTRWLFSNVFKDSNDAKSQLYIPMTYRAPYLTSQGDFGYATIGSEQLDEDSTGISWNNFADQCLEIFNVFQADSIFQIIAGDILKAYGKEALNKYPELDATMDLQPIHDEFILTQIQNASLSVTGSVEITVEPGQGDDFPTMVIKESVTYDPETNNLPGGSPTYPQRIEAINRWIINPTYNTNVNETDPGRLLSTTRFMASRHAVNAADNAGIGQIIYDTYGTELLTEIRVIYTDDIAITRGKYGLAATKLRMFVNAAQVTSTGATFFGDVPAWSWFNYCPFIVTKIPNDYNKTVQLGLPMFDFNNFGLAYKSNLDSYNAIATLSMLHKPFVSRVNKVEVFDI